MRSNKMSIFHLLRTLKLLEASMELKRTRCLKRSCTRIWESFTRSSWRGQNCQIQVMECSWIQQNTTKLWGNWHTKRSWPFNNRNKTRTPTKRRSQGNLQLMSTLIWFQMSLSIGMHARKRKYCLKTTAITNLQVQFLPRGSNWMVTKNIKQEFKVPTNHGNVLTPILEKDFKHMSLLSKTKIELIGKRL